MTRSPRRLASLATLGVAAGIVIVALGPGAALAVEPPPARAVPAAGKLCAAEWAASRVERSVETLRAAGLCEVDRRLAALDRLDGALADAEVLGDDHRAALTATVATTRSGLTGLRAEIDAGTDLAGIAADVRAIFSEYRVYAVVVRQAMLVRAADGSDAAIARLDDVAAELAEAIEVAEAGGIDVAAARTHLAALAAARDRAAAALDGVAGDVLAVTPAAWNDGNGRDVIRGARDDLRTARAALGEAAREARRTLAELRGRAG